MEIQGYVVTLGLMGWGTFGTGNSELCGLNFPRVF